jgi:hypothetical protein
LQDYFSVITINLSGAGGGSTPAGGGGGKGGFAEYTFANIPPNTRIDYTVGAAGTSGNGTGGGGGATTMTIGDNTVIAGGGGSAVKRSAGLPATQPFGGAISSDGSAGFVYNNTGITAPPPAGFVFTVGGGGEPMTNGSISIAPSPSNYLVGSGTFGVPAAVNNAKITIYGARGGVISGGSQPGIGGKVEYTGNLPAGTYSWYVGNRGNGQLAGSGYKPGINGIIINPATQPFGGEGSTLASAGLVFTNGSTSTTQDGLTITPGGGSAPGTDGRVSIELPRPITNTYTSGDTTWVSPDYLSTLIIELIGGGGGGGSSGTSSGGNRGGGGGRGTLTLTGVPPKTSFSVGVGNGGQGSQASGPRTDDTIRYGSGGTLYGSDGVGNGAGGGGVSIVSYYDPVYAGYVIIVAGGGGGGAGCSYYSGGRIVDGGPGGRGGQTGGAQVGGRGGEIDPEFGFPGLGENGSIDWDTPGQAWNPIIQNIGGLVGGAAGNPDTGTNSGSNGGNGRIRFTATPLGNTADYTTPGQINFTPTATSTYIITVDGPGGGAGAGGRGKYTTTLTQNIQYPVTVGAKGIEGSGGGASTFGNLTVGGNTGVILRGGGGKPDGATGSGGGGSSALVFPSGYVIGAGGGGGALNQLGNFTNSGRGGGSDDNGANGGTQGGGQGVGFSIGSTPPSSSVSTFGGGNTEGITIEYDPTNINTTGSGSFITQVSGAYIITVIGAGVEGKGGKGVYSTPPIPSGTNLTYSVGSAENTAFPGGPTYISPFALAGGAATLRAGGGGSYTNQPVEGAPGGGGIYGGLGGNPTSSITAGFPGTGGSATLTGVTSVLGGGARTDTNGSIYFTVSYTTPFSSPSLTTYSNSGVLFPSSYMAVSSKLSKLGLAKSIMLVYQCPSTNTSINIGVGLPNVVGGSFGICQTGGTLYSPYQYGSGYDLTFTPSNYTAKRYAFASYNTEEYAITGMPGFNDTSMNAVAFKNLITDTSLILGRQLAGYPSGDFILHELIATSNALTSSDRQDVEGYLAAKWGLSAQLPSSHPYKNFEPSGDQWIPPTLPTTISGLVSWLDMTYSGQTTASIVDRVGGSFTVNVGSGNQFQLSNINNLPSLYFPGNSSNYLYKTSLPPTAEGSVLFVFNISDDRSSLPILTWRASSGTAPWGPLLLYSPQTLLLINNYSGTAGGDATTLTLAMTSGTNLVFFAWDYTNFYLSVNGGIPVIGSNAIPGSATTMYIGANTTTGRTPIMNFGELVVYNQYFERSERQLLEGYLAWKWALQGNLPLNHPFSKESPTGATVSETGALNIPAQIASLTTWLDAADSTTINLKPGFLVQQWYDKSATSDIFTGDDLPTYTNTPTGSPSLPGVYFSFSNSLRGTVDAAIGSGVGTCFMVATVGNNAQVFMGGYVNSTPRNGDSFGLMSVDLVITSPIQGVDRVNRNPLLGGLYDTNPTTVLFARMNATINPPTGDGSYSFKTPVNQTEVINNIQRLWQPSVPSPSPWNLGFISTNPAPQDSYIHEFLCFSESFTDSQRFVVEGYLAWKWGIQSQLPVDHPYKNARPQSYSA